jgi:hypothetical protein
MVVVRGMYSMYGVGLWVGVGRGREDCYYAGFTVR